MGGRTLSYHNFSWQGDPRWAEASRFTLYGPVVVFVILLLSIAQIAFGSVWLVELKSNMSVPKIIQTLLIPGCSFFNAIPSLHLHLLLRRNPPTMAIWFSSIFAIVYFVDSVLMLSSCSASAPLGLRRTECPSGTAGVQSSTVSPGIWAAMGATGLLSAACYSVHAGMAFHVGRVLRYRKAQGLEPAVDPDEQEAERQKARDLWIKMSNRDIL